MHGRRFAIGKVARGEQFIGRADQVKLIYSDLVDDGCNISIVGLGQIGKSSIAHRVFDQLKETPGCLAVYIDLQGYIDSRKVLESIIEELSYQMSEPEYIPAASGLAADLDSLALLFRRQIRRSLKNGKHVYLFVDEFDNVKHLGGCDALCRMFRSFAYGSGGVKISLVLISRRSVAHIEAASADISNLDGIFKKHYIRPLSAIDMRLFCEAAPLALPDSEVSKEILPFIGRHPFLLVTLLSDLGSQSLGDAVTLNRTHRVEYYARIERFLFEFRPSLLTCLGALSAGLPAESEEEVLELRRYGIISNEEELNYTLSMEFSNFIRSDRLARNAPSLWSRLEKQIRKTIGVVLSTKYGDDWRSDLSFLNEMIEGYDEVSRRRVQASRSFGPSAGFDPLSFCYPNHYWTIISKNWKEFHFILGKSRKEWGEHFNNIVQMRNPTAHNWIDAVDRDKIMAADVSMKVILRALEQHRVGSS